MALLLLSEDLAVGHFAHEEDPKFPRRAALVSWISESVTLLHELEPMEPSENLPKA